MIGRRLVLQQQCGTVVTGQYLQQKLETATSARWKITISFPIPLWFNIVPREVANSVWMANASENTDCLHCLLLHLSSDEAWMQLNGLWAWQQFSFFFLFMRKGQIPRCSSLRHVPDSLRESTCHVMSLWLHLVLTLSSILHFHECVVSYVIKSVKNKLNR